MTFEQLDTRTVFGSARDSAPISMLGQHTPAGALWVRTLVMAENIGTAVAWLENINLLRPIETLGEVEGNDWVGQAVDRHGRQLALPDFHALVYIAVATHLEPGRPTVYQLNEKHTGWVEVGYVGFDGGPIILPAPDAFARTDRLIPLTVKE